VKFARKSGFQLREGGRARLASVTKSVAAPSPHKSSTLMAPFGAEGAARAAEADRFDSGLVAASSIASAIPTSTGFVSELRLFGRSMVTDSTRRPA